MSDNLFSIPCTTIKGEQTTLGDFAGKAVFVAGGSSGINLGIAKAFATAGASVAIVSRSPERVAGAVAELRALAAPGARIEGYNADVRDADAIAAVLAQAHAAIGDFDVLVSGAAGNFVAPALGIDGHARSAELVHIAVQRAHRHLQRLGQRLRAHTAARFQQHLEGQQTAGAHGLWQGWCKKTEGQR